MRYEITYQSKLSQIFGKTTVRASNLSTEISDLQNQGKIIILVNVEAS